MKTMHLSIIIMALIAIGAMAFWIFHKPSLLTSDKENFSEPIIEQIANYSQISHLIGLNNDTNYVISLTDWSRDDQFIISHIHHYGINKDELVAFDPTFTKFEKIRISDFSPIYPAKISPTSMYLLFSGEKHNPDGSVSSNLFVYNMKNKTTVQITNNTKNDSDYRNTSYQYYGWISDQNIIYDEENDFPLPKHFGTQDTSVWVADYNGKKIKSLCNSTFSSAPNFPNSPNSCFDADMDVSPDGKKVAFDANQGIGIYHMDTNQTTFVGENIQPCITHPVWIPNSQMITYDYSPGCENTLRTGILSTDGQFNEIVYSGGGGSPIASPDGKYILVTNGNGDIMRISFGK